MINLKAPSPIEREEAERTVTERVRSILDRVSRDGERALSELNHQLDDYEGPILIREKALNMALAQMDKPLRQAVEIAVDHVRSFHRAQRKLFQDQEWEISEGIQAGMRFLPVKSAGVYVPGGRYPLVSTAVMGVVPAQEAGVSRIIVFSPPRGSCGISRPILGTLALLGIQEVLAVGGAQGVGALARGLPGIPPVDLLVGPGNAYVTEAKRQLFGKVGIDSLAGPSEVFVIADRTANPALLAADLLAQAEHDPDARAFLVTTSRREAEAVSRALARLADPDGIAAAALARHGAAIVVRSREEALDLVNRIAPEHLATDDEWLAAQRPLAGTIFLGACAAPAAGDYATGSNHVLPTAGAARFRGGLTAADFVRVVAIQRVTRAGLRALAGPAVTLARVEGLVAHAASIEARMG